MCLAKQFCVTWTIWNRRHVFVFMWVWKILRKQVEEDNRKMTLGNISSISKEPPALVRQISALLQRIPSFTQEANCDYTFNFGSLNYAADLLDVVFCHLALHFLPDGKRPRGRQGLSGLSQALADELAGVFFFLPFIQYCWKTEWKIWWVKRDRSYSMLAYTQTPEHGRFGLSNFRRLDWL